MVELEIVNKLTGGCDSVAQSTSIGVAEDNQVKVDCVVPNKLAFFALNFIIIKWHCNIRY